MNMKKLFWKSRTFVLVVSMVIILLVSPSCKSLKPSIASSATNTASAAIHTHDTVVMHDSIFIREVMRGDTVYLTRTEWRDRWRTRLVHDTIRDTQVVEKVIEKPPVRYVPKFYKWCTIALWAIGILAIGYWAMKRWGLARFLQKDK